MLHGVVSQILTNISEEVIASIIRVTSKLRAKIWMSHRSRLNKAGPWLDIRERRENQSEGRQNKKATGEASAGL
jgi:hypothetical protein